MTDTYDFNSAYGHALPVFNQGQVDDCWDFAWANHLNAWRLIYDGKTTRYDAKVAANWSGLSGGPGFVFHTPDGDMQATHVDAVQCASLPIRAIRNALLHNGAVGLTVPSRAHNFAKFHAQETLPVIHMTPNEHPNPDHGVLGVGYTANGVIMLNSWGKQYGCQGRAVLSWDFLRRGCSISVEVYGDHPLNGLHQT